MLGIIYFIGFVWICNNMAKEKKRKLDELLKDRIYEDIWKNKY